MANSDIQRAAKNRIKGGDSKPPPGGMSKERWNWLQSGNRSFGDKMKRAVAKSPPGVALTETAKSKGRTPPGLPSIPNPYDTGSGNKAKKTPPRR